MFVECLIPDRSAYKGVEVNIYSVFLDFYMVVMLVEKQCSNQK